MYATVHLNVTQGWNTFAISVQKNMCASKKDVIKMMACMKGCDITSCPFSKRYKIYTEVERQKCNNPLSMHDHRNNHW